MLSQDKAQWCRTAAPGDLTDSSGERDSWSAQVGSAAAGPPACVPGSTNPEVAQTGTPCSWLPLAAGGPGGSCRHGHLWAWRGLEQHLEQLCPHLCSLQPLPVTARGQSHLCLLASIPCFSGCKVASREVLWEMGAPGYLLQRRGLLARAVPSQLGSKAQLAILGSALRSSVKCPGGGQNVII